MTFHQFASSGDAALLTLIVTMKTDDGWHVDESRTPSSALGTIHQSCGLFAVDLPGTSAGFQFATFDNAVDYFAELAWALHFGEGQPDTLDTLPDK